MDIIVRKLAIVFIVLFILISSTSPNKTAYN